MQRLAKVERVVYFFQPDSKSLASPVEASLEIDKCSFHRLAAQCLARLWEASCGEGGPTFPGLAPPGHGWPLQRAARE